MRLFEMISATTARMPKGPLKSGEKIAPDVQAAVLILFQLELTKVVNMTSERTREVRAYWKLVVSCFPPDVLQHLKTLTDAMLADTKDDLEGGFKP